MPQPAHVEEERKGWHDEPPERGIEGICLVFCSLTGWMRIFTYSVGKMAIKSTKKEREADNPNSYCQKKSVMCTFQVCFG